MKRAALDLNKLLWAWMERHDLSYTEAMACLLTETHRLNDFRLRMERHPDDPGKQAHEA